MKYPLILDPHHWAAQLRAATAFGLNSCRRNRQRSNSQHLPVSDLVIYDENTDVNHLLKRPGQYIEKANFTDTRVKQDFEPATDADRNALRKCTIEVFANTEDLNRRKEYLETIGKAAAVFGGYVYPHKNVLVRIDFKLPPEQAEQYRQALDSL
jgi:hypothetical protein